MFANVPELDAGRALPVVRLEQQTQAKFTIFSCMKAACAACVKLIL